ncbi:MAG TPA: acyl carrier protein [Rhodanobacter sp.]|nr:acyl carrier protein [Rhodanobacter sp.]
MSNEPKEIEAKVRGYILENLLFSSDPTELPNDASLLDRGIIDSTGVLEIVLFLEGEFDIQIKASEMLPENFDTVNNMVAFVQRLRVAA